jgi:hypothetical protein
MKDKRLRIMTVCAIVNSIIVEDEELGYTVEELLDNMVFGVESGELVAFMHLEVIANFVGIKKPKKVAKRLNKALAMLSEIAE